MRRKKYSIQFLSQLRRKETCRGSRLELRRLRSDQYYHEFLSELRRKEAGRRQRLDLPRLRPEGNQNQLLP